MKKTIATSLMVILSLCCSVSLFCQTVAEVPENYYQENVGSIENPYQISNLANLRWLSETEDFYVTNSQMSEQPIQQQTFTYFIQTANIDASETVAWNEGRGFMPIGLLPLGGSPIPEITVPITTRSFFGNYNGNNYSIYGLHIRWNRESASDLWGYPGVIGMFGNARSSEFINIKLENINYEIRNPYGYIGSLVGESAGGIISNCSVSGDIHLEGENLSGANSGGLVGFTANNRISNCSSKVNIYDNITSESQNVPVIAGIGGLAGIMVGASITDSFYYGKIISNTVGGIMQGGLVGDISISDIVNCYVASISEFVNTKGTFGVVSIPPQTENYLEVVTVANAFWDVNATGTSDPYFSILLGWGVDIDPEDLPLDMIGLPTNQMKLPETFIEAGWDMQQIWGISPEINNGYPYLRNITLPPTETSPINLTGDIEGNQVVLSWQAPTESIAGGILGFKVYRNTDLLTTLAGETLSFIDNTIVENEVYTYGVSTVYLHGISMPTYVTPEQPASETNETAVPAKGRLLGNYPNPFNPETTISFDIVSAGNVRIDIFNLKGQKVRTVTDKHFGSGSHKVVWNGDDDAGHGVSSGIYFYQMQADGVVSSKKMVLMK